MSNVDTVVKQLITAILESDIYLEYVEKLEQIKQHPELKKRVDDLRTRNYILQTEGEVALDKLDQYEREFEECIENPCVDEFFNAELALCKMIQDIDTSITEAIRFE